ncbi:hypothetical protein AB9N12_11740 [Bacteroides sp. AN502(2024)]|uniref:hypothetical protein n=1 Tax=Bacteroides sp. AN502(2024) TaxID=3160599 RepID=UPI0035148EEB
MLKELGGVMGGSVSASTSADSENDGDSTGGSGNGDDGDNSLDGFGTSRLNLYIKKRLSNKSYFNDFEGCVIMPKYKDLPLPQITIAGVISSKREFGYTFDFYFLRPVRQPHPFI